MIISEMFKNVQLLAEPKEKATDVILTLANHTDTRHVT